MLELAYVTHRWYGKTTLSPYREYVYDSREKRCLLVLPYFFNRVHYVLLTFLECFLKWELSHRKISFCRVLLPGYIQISIQHFCVFPIKLFYQAFHESPIYRVIY